MARSAFGGVGDYSQLFAALYQQNRAELERLASAAERRNKEAQAATDADMFDRWSQGEVSDDEILAYIEKRVQETVHDPKEHAEWKKAQRDYGERIADDRAELAFQNGGSINDLIAYYQDKLTGVNKDSPAYRETSQRLNDLKDQRASEDINTGSEQLMDKIERGQATWKDLVAFYKSKLSSLRPNSPLRKQLESALNNAQDKVHEQEVQAAFNKLQYEFDAGKISGKTYGAGLRSLAQQFKDSDPARYYQILSAATKVEKRVSTGGGGGGGGGGSSSKSIRSTIDAIQGQKNMIEAMIEAYERGNKTYVGPDGKMISLTPDFIKKLDNQWLDASKSLESAYLAKGDKSAAGAEVERRSKYLVNHIQPHNTLPREAAFEEFLTASEKRLQDAANGGNPAQLQKVVQAIANQATVFGVTGGDPKDQANSEWQATMLAINKYFQTVANPKSSVADVQAALAGIEQAMLVEPNTGSSLQVHARLSQIVNRIVGTGNTPGLGPAMHIGATIVQGLADGTHMIIQGEDGAQIVPVREITYEDVQIDPNTGTATLVTRTDLVPDVQIDGKTQQWTDIYVTVDGKIQKRKAIATVSDSPLLGLVAKKDIKIGGVTVAKGQAITQTLFSKAREGEIEGYIASGSITRESVMKFLTVKDDQGAIWSQDPETKQWFKGSLPFRHVPLDPLGLGTVLLDDNGKPAVDYRPFSHGVPAPFSGKTAQDAKLMQDYFDKGLVSTDGVAFRDENGNVTDDPQYNPFRLAYKGATDFVSDLKGGGRDSWWDDADREATRKAIQDNFYDPAKVPTDKRKLVRGFPSARTHPGEKDTNKAIDKLAGKYDRRAQLQAHTSRPAAPWDFGPIGQAVGAFASALGLNMGQEPERPVPTSVIPAVQRRNNYVAPVAPVISQATSEMKDLDLSGILESTKPKPKPTSSADSVKLLPPTYEDPNANSSVQQTRKSGGQTYL